jgi:hypothetical protein
VSEDRRRLAVDLFNHVWTLLDKADRTPEEDDEMVHAAHASRLHWAEVGARVNLVRGEWQISRVYATLGRPEPALYHAKRCLELCEGAELEDFDLPYAYEALARAHAIAGNWKERDRYEKLARDAGERIADADDREHFLADLSTLPSRG